MDQKKDINDLSTKEKDDLTYDYLGKRLLSHVLIIAELVKVFLPEEFLGMKDSEIIKKYLQTSTPNHNRVDLKTQEINTVNGKQTKYDLHFEVLTPSGKTVLIILELQRNKDSNFSIRALVYPSKLIAEQEYKNYDDFNPVISGWINLEPLERFRNTVIVSEMVSSELKINGIKYNKKIIENYENPFNLIRIVEINIGGPEYDNFKGIIKLLYNLLHNKKEEVKEFFSKIEHIEFDLDEVLNPMEIYSSFDEQTRNYYKEKYKKKYKEEGRAEGIQEGRAEGIQEGKAEGRKEGIAEGRKERTAEIQEKVLKNLKNLNYSDEEIQLILNGI